MNQAITVSPKIIAEITKQLGKLSKEVETIKAKLFGEEPRYGSDEWWKWSDEKALKEIKEGKYTKVSNKKELTAFLDSLK